jgi:ankyrin repeat protein
VLYTGIFKYTAGTKSNSCIFLTDEKGEVPGKMDLLVFKYLVENKSDPKAKTELGYTPLHCAALRPSFDIIKYIVENKLSGIP